MRFNALVAPTTPVGVRAVLAVWGKAGVSKKELSPLLGASIASLPVRFGAFLASTTPDVPTPRTSVENGSSLAVVVEYEPRLPVYGPGHARIRSRSRRKRPVAAGGERVTGWGIRAGFFRATGFGVALPLGFRPRLLSFTPRAFRSRRSR